MFELAVRNIYRNGARLRPMVAIMVLSFALLIIGNAVLSFADQAFYQAFARNIAADMGVSPVAQEKYTLFGADVLLVGEYLVPPVLPEFEKLQQAAQAMPQVRATAGVISTAARIEFESGSSTRSADLALFGVDFADYAKLFPQLEIVKGGFPAVGQTGIMLQEQHARNAELGTPVLLMVSNGISFTIREVPLAGVYRYPVHDRLLDRLALLDAETARALNGYVYASQDTTEIPAEEEALFSSDLDDLFGTGGGEETQGFGSMDAGIAEGAEQSSSASVFDELDSLFSDTADDLSEQDGQIASTAVKVFNHLLISLNDRDQDDAVRHQLVAAGFSADQYEIRDWRNTVGGSAVLVWYLQIMLNAGLFFVALGAAIITSNALMLSVLERRKEIGTMRALGASRARVSLMVSIESMIVMVGAAFLGILLGVCITLVFNRFHFSTDNQYIEILFGGGSLQARASISLVVAHLIGAVFLAAVALLYPLRYALRIPPAAAMSE